MRSGFGPEERGARPGACRTVARQQTEQNQTLTRELSERRPSEDREVSDADPEIEISTLIPIVIGRSLFRPLQFHVSTD